MKNKEEIERLAQEIHYSSARKGLDANGCFNQYQGFILGYTQCQEDMADVITNNNKECAKQCAEITKELEEVREQYNKLKRLI